MRLTRPYQAAAAIAGIVALSFGAAGCSNSSPTSPSDFVAFSEADLIVGTGAEVVTGSVVTINYAGWFYDPTTADHKGVQFATSLGSTTPFQVTVGAGQVIAGWDRGLLGMLEGGTRRLVIPPSLGYGGTRYGEIPPYTTLVFDIQVVTVQ